MARFPAICAGVLLLGAAPVPYQEGETARLAAVEARGATIAAYDRAAWVGTDDMLKRLPDARNRVGGWIVDGPRDRPVVIFHDRAPTPRGLYAARLRDGKLVDPELLDGTAAVLSPERLALIAARNAATRAIETARIAPCTSSFNTVVLPPDAPGAPTRVYFLSAQTDAAHVVIGGHHRVEVDADGRAGPVHAFSKGCMTPNRPPRDARGAILFVTTLTDTIPNETHVFTAWSYGLALAVAVPGTPQTIYAIVPGQPIRRIAAKGTSSPARPPTS